MKRTTESCPSGSGIFEANAIALRIEDIETPRPMTHDLIADVLKAMDASVDKIVVNELRDNTYFALIHLQAGGQEYIIDSRPSDAIALALRAKARIYVDQAVFDQAKTLEGEQDLSDSERLRKWFENLDPEEFSKYKM